jgi:NADPH:quinone reductase-like Zn-dependent oxidoreductase
MNVGAYAEYVCLPGNGALAIKPNNISYEEAAAILLGGNTAMYFLRKGNIQASKKCLSMELPEQLVLLQHSLPNILAQKLRGMQVRQMLKW